MKPDKVTEPITGERMYVVLYTLLPKPADDPQVIAVKKQFAAQQALRGGNPLAGGVLLDNVQVPPELISTRVMYSIEIKAGELPGAIVDQAFPLLTKLQWPENQPDNPDDRNMTNFARLSILALIEALGDRRVVVETALAIGGVDIRVEYHPALAVDSLAL